MDKTPTFGSPDSSVRYTRRPGVYGIVLDQDKVGVIQKPDGAMFLPGSGIEDGETVEEALLREIREELGCDVGWKQFLGRAEEYSPRSKDDRRYHFHNEFNRIEVDSAAIRDNEAAHAVCWVEVREVLRGLQQRSLAWALEMLNAESE